MVPRTSIPRQFHQFAAGLHEHREPLDLVEYLLSGLHHMVPSDYNSWKEIIFGRQPKVAAVFSPQNPEAANRLPVFQRHAKDHPVWTHWRESGQYHVASRWSDVEGRSNIHHTPLYQEFYRPLGVRHQVMVALETKPSRLIYIALNRSRTPFTDQDSELLTALQPHAAHAFQSVLSVHRLQATLASYSTFVDSLAQGIVCLAPDLRIRWASTQARTLLRTHLRWEANTSHLPEALHQWLTKSRQRLGGAPRNCSIRSEAGALIARVLEKQKMLYLFLECSEQPQQQHTFDALKTFGLTNREAEVLGWTARGKSNDETAAILGMSLHTVKKHLERIYTVIGATNRVEAALKAHAILSNPLTQ